MKRVIIVAAIALLPFAAFAGETCRASLGISTPKGRLGSITCVDSQGVEVGRTITLDGTPLLKDSHLVRQGSDKRRLLWVFMGPPIAETGCSDRVYLIDLNFAPPKIIAFGVRQACNEFSEGYWGEKRSTLVLKRDVKFIYSNGKMILPKPGLDLVNSALPSSLVSLSIENSVPFAEEVPLAEQSDESRSNPNK